MELELVVGLVQVQLAEELSSIKGMADIVQRLLWIALSENGAVRLPVVLANAHRTIWLHDLSGRRNPRRRLVRRNAFDVA